MTFIPLGFFHLILESSSIRGDKEGRDVDRTVRELGASGQAGACGHRLRSPASQPATGQAGLSHERGLVPGACGSVKPPPQAVMEEPPPPPGAERACPREGPHAGLGQRTRSLVIQTTVLLAKFPGMDPGPSTSIRVCTAHGGRRWAWLGEEALWFLESSLRLGRTSCRGSVLSSPKPGQ